MAFIDYIQYDDASEQLRALYDQYKNAKGSVANIVRIAGPNPAAMKGHIDFYRAIMFGKSPLSRHQREMIAVVVSVINQCHY
ncbi:MAG: carboxymuconolactone decarboxylase family protein [bacterium]|nr:carboxymuconolactone decarboxylase family protein [bacterium]